VSSSRTRSEWEAARRGAVVVVDDWDEDAGATVRAGHSRV
jgi:hypothetical protein